MKKASRYTVASRQAPSLAVKASWSQETAWPDTTDVAAGVSPTGAKSAERPRRVRVAALQPPLTSTSVDSPARTAQAPAAPVAPAQAVQAAQTTQAGAAPPARLSKLPATRHKLNNFHKLLDDMLSEVRMQYPHLPPAAGGGHSTSEARIDECMNDEVIQPPF